MANRTERDFAPESRDLARRRFMIAGEHVILRAFEADDLITRAEEVGNELQRRITSLQALGPYRQSGDPRWN